MRQGTFGGKTYKVVNDDPDVDYMSCYDCSLSVNHDSCKLDPKPGEKKTLSHNVKDSDGTVLSCVNEYIHFVEVT